LGRWQQSLGTNCSGDFHGQIPTGENLHLGTDHSIRFGVRYSPGFLCFNWIHGTPFRNIAHQQLGLRLVGRWVEKVNRCSGNNAYHCAHNDCSLAFKQSEENVAQLHSRVMLCFALYFSHNFNL
jgi:hypothetical protein